MLDTVACSGNATRMVPSKHRCPHHQPCGKTQPAAKFRLGYVTATVWRNDDFFNTVLSQSYEDGDEYKDTDQLAQGDLMNAVRALQRTEEFISDQ